MRMLRAMLLIAVSSASVSAFAANTAMMTGPNDENSNQQCAKIAKACLNAGYTQRKEGKGFWKDCMKPILLNQAVNGVKIDAQDSTTCREAKIAQMKEELDQLQQVKS